MAKPEQALLRGPTGLQQEHSARLGPERASWQEDLQEAPAFLALEQAQKQWFPDL